MKGLRSVHGLLAALLLGLLVGCGVVSEPAQPPAPEAPSLELVQRHALKALDADLSSDDRRLARDDARAAFLSFLRTPASLRVAKAEWEREAVFGQGPLIRVFAADSMRVYAMSLPVPGTVPPGEILLLQIRPASGSPEAYELQTLPGGRIAVADAIPDGNGMALVSAFSLDRGGGYVAAYHRDPKTKQYQPDQAAWRSVPGRVGDLSFDPSGQFLQVSWPNPDPWQPQIVKKTTTRLFVHQDVALEWKANQFIIVDERSQSAFLDLNAAYDSSHNKADRDESWAKATQKLPAYLTEMSSWSDDLAAKLPPGATLTSDQASGMAVRVVSVPAPTAGQAPFTVIQHRIGGGLPGSQVVSIPGVVESIKIVARQGLPGLLLLSGPPKGTTEQPAGGVRKAVTILRQTTGSDWEPAPDWFGYLPTGTGWQMQRRTGSADLILEPESVRNAGVSISGAQSGRPGFVLCLGPQDCFSLSWAGDALSGIDWFAAKVRAISRQGATVSVAQVGEAATAVQRLLLTPEGQSAGVEQLAEMLGRGSGAVVDVFDAGNGTRVVGLPLNPAGNLPLVIAAGAKAMQDSPAPGLVQRWTGARVVEASGSRWLLVLGRGQGTALLTTYVWSDGGWTIGQALDRPLDRKLGQSSRISYIPGQTKPYRGLLVTGPDLVSGFTPDGRGVSFCDAKRNCAVYAFQGRWELR